jgi:hypothetical protein
MDSVRNQEVWRRCGSEVNIVERIARNVLRCYGHVERMEEERMFTMVYSAKVEGSRAKGRPKMRWIDSVKASVERKGMNAEEAKRCAQDRGEWRRVVYS